MDLGTFQRQTVKALSTVYSQEEAASICKLVLTEALGYRAHEIAMRQSESVQGTTLQRLEGIVQRLLDQEPVQYIFGRAWFNGMHLRVNKFTLIPRQETEELVAWITDDGVSPGSRILDIGTGSGCIAISLAKAFPNSRVEAIDVSEGALHVAAVNAREQEVAVRFFKRDVLVLSSLDTTDEDEVQGHFDIIVSNPPYVRDLEKREIAPNVLEFEPETARFVSDHDPLVFYRKIAKLAFDNLLEGGRLYFEINQYLGTETESLIKEIGFTSVELRKDLLGNNRMIKAIK